MNILKELADKYRDRWTTANSMYARSQGWDFLPVRDSKTVPEFIMQSRSGDWGMHSHSTALRFVKLKAEKGCPLAAKALRLCDEQGRYTECPY